jgi:hypothetical protein
MAVDIAHTQYCVDAELMLYCDISLFCVGVAIVRFKDDD